MGVTGPFLLESGVRSTGSEAFYGIEGPVLWEGGIWFNGTEASSFMRVTRQF